MSPRRLPIAPTATLTRIPRCTSAYAFDRRNIPASGRACLWRLDHQWTDWFGGLAITLQRNGDTLLSGPIVDQAALHGLLRKVRDVPLLFITPRDYESNVDHHKGEIA